jgi:hypothetical protein
MKTPLAAPSTAMRCDLRLPAAALEYRRTHRLLTAGDLGRINVTAWLYRDESGREAVQVNPNVPLGDLRRPGETRQNLPVEVGFHSEGIAAEWFRTRRNLTVLQIFTERFPCAAMCGPLLRAYYPGWAWYFYYRPSSWKDEHGQFVARAAGVLRTAYGLA